MNSITGGLSGMLRLGSVAKINLFDQRLEVLLNRVPLDFVRE